MARYFIFALIAFLLFFRINPNLDHDVYLYQWEGYVTASGVNPYAAPPNDYSNTSLAIKFPYWSELQFKEYRSIYPPVSQVIFMLNYLLFGFSLIGMRITFFIFILGSIWVIKHILIELKIPISRIWLFVANLVIYYNVTGTIHNDILMMFFLLLAILFFFRKKELLSGIFFGLAIGTKYVPIFLLPLFVSYAVDKKKFFVSVGTSISISFLPFLINTSPANFFQTLVVYTDRWTYTPGVFGLTQKLFSALNFASPFLITKILFWLVLFILIVFLSLKTKKTKKSLIESSVLILGFLLVANSVLFPWYLIWVLPFTPLIKNPWPWIVLGFSSLFITWGGYGQEGLQLWRQLLVWIPFYLVLLISFIHERIKSRHNYTDAE